MKKQTLPWFMRRAAKLSGRSVTIDPTGPQIVAAFSRLPSSARDRVFVKLWSLADAADPWKRDVVFGLMREAITQVESAPPTPSAISD